MNLDVAWHEAEAALPKGWRLSGLVELDEGRWQASAHNRLYQLRGHTDEPFRSLAGTAPNPTDALLKLTKALTERTP